MYPGTGYPVLGTRDTEAYEVWCVLWFTPPPTDWQPLTSRGSPIASKRAETFVAVLGATAMTFEKPVAVNMLHYIGI